MGVWEREWWPACVCIIMDLFAPRYVTFNFYLSHLLYPLVDIQSQKYFRGKWFDLNIYRANCEKKRNCVVLSVGKTRTSWMVNTFVRPRKLSRGPKGSRNTKKYDSVTTKCHFEKMKCRLWNSFGKVIQCVLNGGRIAKFFMSKNYPCRTL